MPVKKELRRPDAIRRGLALIVVITGIPALGHAQLLNEAEPLTGITTSGQPDEAALVELAEKGFTMVIDLRAENEDRGFEESDAVEELGMSYITLPVSGTDAINYENAAALDAFLGMAEGPVLIHCGSGNRVGALLSLRQRLVGDDADTALTIGLKAGLTSPALQDVVESRLAEL